MSQPDAVTFALHFTSGLVMFMERGGAYFLPANTMEAFQIYGERKELFGKHAISVRGNRETGEPDYSVVYEFNDAKVLSDARLVTRDHTLRGTLADQQTIDALNGALLQNALMLYTTRDTRADSVFNAARFADGRYLIQMSNDNVLYLGTPGNYEKLEAKLHIQGGNSMYYRDTDGGMIELPWGMGGPRHGEMPKFKGETLNYVEVGPKGDPAQFGLSVAGKPAHLSPFHPLLAQDSAGAQPKPPQP